MTERALLLELQHCTLNEKVVGGVLTKFGTRFQGEVRLRVVGLVDRVAPRVLTRVRSAQTRLNVGDHRNVLVGERGELAFLIGRRQRRTRAGNEIVAEEPRVQTGVRIVLLQDTAIVLEELRVAFDARVPLDRRAQVVARRRLLRDGKIGLGQGVGAVQIDRAADEQKDHDQTIEQRQEKHVHGDQRKENDSLRVLRSVEDEIIGEDQRERAAEDQGDVRVFGDQQIATTVDLQGVLLLEQTVVANEILQNADGDDEQVKGTEIDQNLLHEGQRQRVEGDRRVVQEIRIVVFEKENDRVDDRERDVREGVGANPVAMQTVVQQRFRREDHYPGWLRISETERISREASRESSLYLVSRKVGRLAFLRKVKRKIKVCSTRIQPRTASSSFCEDERRFDIAGGGEGRAVGERVESVRRN